jgi:hypothetical protein
LGREWLRAKPNPEMMMDTPPTPYPEINALLETLLAGRASTT